MVNTNYIKGAIVAAGFNQSDVARTMGISNASLSYKINNKKEFKLCEVESLCSLLGILPVAEVFFVKKVD